MDREGGGEVTDWKRRLHTGYERFETGGRRYPEAFALGAYLLLLAVMLYFHEPWYDEAQAWLIARDASLREMLFVIPHYEGHPPFWFLLLAIFAKAGADFALTIKLLSFAINASTVAFLLFRAPFPRAVRLALPFTYFLLYQHGVICRPYSLLLLGFLLAAAFWHTKEKSPFRFSVALMLLCASSAYGILFAGGIAIVWLLELRKESSDWGAYFRSLLCGRRFAAMLTLLLFALLQIVLIIPRSDTFAASYGFGGENSVWFRLLYMLFGAIADATCFSAYDSYDELRYATFSVPKVIFGCVIGLLLLALIYLCGRKARKRLLFFLPYGMFVLFSGVVYFYLQHVDVLLQFLLFWCWVCRKEPPRPPVTEGSKGRVSVLAVCTCVCIGLSLCISVFWTAAACRNEVLYPYGFSEQLADYLNEHGLSGYGVMVRWKVDKDDDGTLLDNNTNQTVNGVALNAYYAENIVLNMNGGDPSMPYVTHRIPGREEVDAELQRLREQGLPAIAFDKVQLELLFPELEDIFDTQYTAVLLLPEYHLWKSGYKDTYHFLYVRNDIAREHGLTE